MEQAVNISNVVDVYASVEGAVVYENAATDDIANDTKPEVVCNTTTILHRSSDDLRSGR